MLVISRNIFKEKKNSKIEKSQHSLFSFFHFFTIIICCSFVVNGCAKMAPPQGGPTDEISPKVVSSIPANNALSVSENIEIEIQFSEVMNKRPTERALFLFPNEKMEMKWKGDRLYLNPDLKFQTTYILAIGSGASDLRGNTLRKPFQMAFSTGNRLDPGSLQGNLYGRTERSTIAEVFIYELKENSERFDLEKPKYRTQCQIGGQYNFSRLSPGTYRVIAFEDINRNNYPDLEELIGIPSNDTKVRDGLSQVSDLFLVQRENSRVLLETIIASDSRNVELFFSRPVDLSKFSIEIDDLRVDTYFLSEDKRKITIITELQQAGRVYHFEVLRYDGMNIGDEKYFRGSEKSDLISPRFLGLNEKNIFANSSLEFNFSEAMDSTFLSNLEFPYDENQQYLGAWRWTSPNQLHFVSAQPWTINRHVLNVDSKGLVDLSGWPLLDSLFTVEFRVMPTSGRISGVVVGHGRSCSVFLKSESYGWTRDTNPDDFGRFSFLKMPPGNYSLWAYNDENGDDNWNAGTLRPYIESEERVMFKYSIELNSDEHLEDLLLDLSFEK